MATQFVNKHITRVLAAGGTIADLTWLGTVDAWITSQGLLPYLFDWANPAFGVIKNGSNEISKIMGLGTTWLSRVGDLTPVTPSSTIYNATAVSGSPGWVSTSTGHCYWGQARGTLRRDCIRRKHHQGLTVAAVYKKTHTNISSQFGMGQFNHTVYLRNSAGNPGSCEFNVGSGSFKATHGTTLANSAVHIIGGTFDGDTVTPYVEGAAGTAVSGYIAAMTDGSHGETRPLRGGWGGSGTQHYYSQGTGTSNLVNTGLTTSTTRGLDGILNEADQSISDLIIFDTALTPTQMASLNTLLRARY